MRSVERGVSVPNILCTRCDGEKEGEAEWSIMGKVSSQRSLSDIFI